MQTYDSSCLSLIVKLIIILTMSLSVTQRIEILILLGCGDKTRTQKQVCEIFNTKYPDRRISQSTVSRIENKFREFGNVTDIPKSGRKRILDDEKKLDVLLDIQDNPHKPTRQVAADNDVSKTSILRLLKNEKYHPYKIHLVQELNEDDPDRRLEFCEIMANRCQDDPLFIKNILFSDEATFVLNGTVNKQNCRYWSTENPHWMMEANTQYPQKVNVWAGIINSQIIGPYFFDSTLTGARYLDFLQNFLVPELRILFPDDDNPNEIDRNIWYQQDGAAPHFALEVRAYLNQVFPNRWIGRRGEIEWPARSPDLTPLDYFLWGYLKSKVYFNRPNNVDDLKERIRQEINQITPETIQNVLEEFQQRLHYCQEATGAQFEHLI